MLDLESLLTPLSEDAPSGVNLEHDPVFLRLELAGAGKLERQYGDKVYPAEPPDWQTVREHANALALRTRDLRVAVWLTRCAARLDGIAGAVSGLQLVHGLMKQRWADVHPQLDASDGNDPTMRRNGLAPLAAANAAISDLRAAALSSARGSATVRDLELGLGLAEAKADEARLSPEGVLDALRAALQRSPELAQALASGRDAAQGIAAIADAELTGAAALDLQPLVTLMRDLDQACKRATGAAGEEAPPANHATDVDAERTTASRSASSSQTMGEVASRDDVVRVIDGLCAWIERNEPSNPAPLLLRRAQRLMSKSFVDIVRELMPEGLDQIEKLAGIDLHSS